FGPDAGQDVIVRFREGTDNSVAATGWWIDDVVLYTNVCGTPTPTPTGTLPTFTRTPTLTSTPSPTGTPCGNVFVNGGFETGTFPPWVVQDTSPAPSVSTAQHHTGANSAAIGSFGSETPGDSSIYQTITIPAGGGTLSYWYYPATV